MATKKDLVEAHGFSRRRLVTAFVSGAPGGREVEPARPGRTIVGGIALSVLLLAGAAVAGFFTGRNAAGWTQQGLVVSQDTAALYVIPEDTPEGARARLYPVINITSARLILNDPDPPLAQVDQSEISRQRIGTERGILGAPAVLPGPGDLVDDGWTACTGDGRGPRLRVAERPDVTVQDDGAYTVRVGSTYHLVAHAEQTSAALPSAYSFRLPGDAGVRDDFLSRLGLDPGGAAPRVDGDFLRLMPPGGEVSLATMGVGRKSPGRLLTDGDRTWLVSGGEAVPASRFAAAAWQSLTGREAERGAPDGGLGEPPWREQHWPETLPEQAFGDDPCLQLLTDPDAPPRVRVADSPGTDARSVDAGRTVSVEEGRGAYVLSADWQAGSPGEPYLVDTTGVRYPLVGAGAATALGYGGVHARRVPDTWVELFTSGTELSHDRAVCPPATGSGQACR